MKLVFRLTMPLAALLLALAPPAGRAAEPARPNIVVILSDDMGFSDLGCYGGEIATPNLDALAAGGLRFTQFYNNARCCPTRASLLTGLYPHQAGVGHMMEDKGKDGYRGDLNGSCRTIAELVKPADYRTYAVGKWHVTRHADKDGPKDNWPLARGFDRYYGTIHGAGSYYDPSSLVRDDKMISPFADPDYKPATYYYTDAITDHAVRFVGDHAKDHAKKPFFLYVAYTAAHWPMHALPEDVKKYQGKYDDGYEPVRKARLEKAAKLGLIDAKQGLSPQVGDWDKVADKKWEAACMEVYAAMIDRMDQGVGKLVAELKRTGQLDNTLILFLQDNGGCAEPMGRAGTKEHPDIERPEKPTFPALKPEEFAAPGSVPKQTREGFPIRMGSKATPGGPDTYVAYGRNWANVSNTPFREYKHWVHEGGISTPLIAHWPTGITARGELRKQPGHLIDIAATCVELAGAEYPKKVGAVAITPAEGKSLVPAFADKPIEREAIYWEHEGNRAVREGDWKLVGKHGGAWELYDLAKDRTESADLAKQQPERVKAMVAKYDAWAKRAGVEPWPVVPPKKTFKVEGHDAFLIMPPGTDGKGPIPWVWYAPTLPGLPEARENWMFEKFLAKGIAIAGVDVGESYGSPKGRAGYTAFYKEMVNNRKFAPQAALLARSRGGLMLYTWAEENPECVSCIAGIYPVCDLRSYPGLDKACGAYGLKRDELEAQLDKHNPVARLEPLAKKGVPIFHIHGDDDKVVPLKDNSAEVALRYEKLGGKMELKVAKGQGHNLWEGFFQCQELVDFIIANAIPAKDPKR